MIYDVNTDHYIVGRTLDSRAQRWMAPAAIVAVLAIALLGLRLLGYAAAPAEQPSTASTPAAVAGASDSAQ